MSDSRVCFVNVGDANRLDFSITHSLVSSKKYFITSLINSAVHWIETAAVQMLCFFSSNSQIMLSFSSVVILVYSAKKQKGGDSNK